MENLCEKHSFGYEPLRLINIGCPVCLTEQLRELQTELDAAKKELKYCQDLLNVDSKP